MSASRLRSLSQRGPIAPAAREVGRGRLEDDAAAGAVDGRQPAVSVALARSFASTLIRQRAPPSTRSTYTCVRSASWRGAARRPGPHDVGDPLSITREGRGECLRACGLFIRLAHDACPLLDPPRGCRAAGRGAPAGHVRNHTAIPAHRRAVSRAEVLRDLVGVHGQPVDASGFGGGRIQASRVEDDDAAVRRDGRMRTRGRVCAGERRHAAQQTGRPVEEEHIAGAGLLVVDEVTRIGLEDHPLAVSREARTAARATARDS